VPVVKRSNTGNCVPEVCVSVCRARCILSVEQGVVQSCKVRVQGARATSRTVLVPPLLPTLQIIHVRYQRLLETCHFFNGNRTMRCEMCQFVAPGSVSVSAQSCEYRETDTHHDDIVCHLITVENVNPTERCAMCLAVRTSALHSGCTQS
jgi:hypothetical protein